MAKRKNKKNDYPVRVYQLGIYSLGGNEQVMLDQLKRGNDYRNKLCEVEWERRKDYHATIAKYVPEYGAAKDRELALDEELFTTRKALQRKRQQARKRLPEEPALRKIVDIGADLKVARDQVKVLKKKFTTEYSHLPEVIATTAEDVARHRIRFKAARKGSQLYSGTYTEIETGMKAATKGPPPRKRRYEGEGKLAIMFGGGIPVTKLFGPNARFKSDAIPEAAFIGTKASRRRNRIVQAKFSIASGDKRKAIMMDIGIIWHRPLPEDGIVKSVVLFRRRFGTKFRWYIQFRIARAAGFVPKDLAKAGRVGVDVGWRKLPTGDIRVAYWAGSDGRQGSVELSPYDIGGWERADSLRGIRDTNFNVMVEMLKEWLGAQTAVPEWLVEQTKTMHAWRATRRLVHVWRQWSENRFAGDEDIFNKLEAWKLQDDHLWDWEANQRRKSINWRQDFYRVFAARTLRQKYRDIIIEKIDWRDFAEKPKPEEDEDYGNNRYNMKLASPGLLQLTIKNSGAAVYTADPKYTTSKCHLCDHLETFDQAKDLYHTCSACGVTWDQDYNAAMNLLKYNTAESQPK